MESSNKPDYSKKKFLIAFICVMGGFAVVRHAYYGDMVHHRVNAVDDVANEGRVVQVVTEQIDGAGTDNVKVKRKSWISPVWSYSKCFPDLQDTQILAARRHGISPVDSREDANEHVEKLDLVNISSSPFYRVDELKHSMPYLVPRAQHLLNTICVNFIDSCQAKGLPLHLPIITSVLRTADDVSKLQRGNQNATTNSCHCYGTTIDITYNKFYPVTTEYTSNPELTRWNDNLKRLLAEVLLDLRKRGLCYVKYERKQACFHLTCR